MDSEKQSVEATEKVASVKVKADEFMCRCSPKETAKCDAVLAAARKIVSYRNEPRDDLNFVDRLMYFLALDGDLSIAADQWAGVYVKPFGTEHDRFKESVRIQCDSIVDGLAAAVVFYEAHVLDTGDAQASPPAVASDVANPDAAGGV